MKSFVLFLIAAVLIPSLTFANCGNTSCDVGAFGQGGASSEGSALGSHTVFPSEYFEGETVQLSGNEFSGRAAVTGGVGSQSGTVMDGRTAGHAAGIFGDWSGQCGADGAPGNC